MLCKAIRAVKWDIRSGIATPPNKIAQLDTLAGSGDRPRPRPFTLDRYGTVGNMAPPDRDRKSSKTVAGRPPSARLQRPSQRTPTGIEGVSMRSLPSQPNRLQWFAPLLLLLVAGSFSCENKHIGRLCALSVDGGSSSGTTATIDVGLECPSRICLLPSQDMATDTTATCTADCSSDDDCSDAETRDKSMPGDTRCSRGFVCKVAQ